MLKYLYMVKVVLHVGVMTSMQGGFLHTENIGRCATFSNAQKELNDSCKLKFHVIPFLASLVVNKVIDHQWLCDTIRQLADKVAKEVYTVNSTRLLLHGRTNAQQKLFEADCVIYLWKDNNNYCGQTVLLKKKKQFYLC